MAKEVGITTTDCNYFDYLRIEKSKRRCSALQKLQRKLNTPLLESTAFIEDMSEAEAVAEVSGGDDASGAGAASVMLCSRLGAAEDLVEMPAVKAQ